MPDPPSNARGKHFEAVFAGLVRRLKALEARSDVPTGAMMYLAGAGAALPSGFVAGGTVLDRQRYGGLFSLFSSEFGGNGSTTFGTPVSPPGVPPPDPALGRWIIRA